MTIAVYGATGKLGRRVAHELARQKIEFVAGGRDEQRLRDLSRELGGLEYRVAAVDDEQSLRKFVDGHRVLINCASPAGICGAPLLETALACRAHYLDAHGEQWFIRQTFDSYGASAQQRGIALIPALGFDFALGDCIARLAACAREPARQIIVAYALRGANVGQDSVRYAGDSSSGPELVYRNGTWRAAGITFDLAFFDFPPPLGRQQMARYGSGEVETIPRHTRTRDVITLITARSLVPHPALLPVFPVLRPLVSMIRRTPLRRLLHLAVPARPVNTAAGEPEVGEFVIAAVATGEDGLQTRGVVSGRDWHHITAMACVAGAKLVLSPDFDRRGALSPASAFDPKTFLDGLQAHGVTWTVD